MSIYNESCVKLTNYNYFENQIRKIRQDKIILECNYTSTNQGFYDNLVNLIYDNHFITKVKIVWHDFVKLKVLEKLSLAFLKYFDESRKLQKLTLVLSAFKPYPAHEMQQDLINVFSIPTSRISLQVKFRKEFLCLESFFKFLSVPSQKISQFQISLEQTGQIKPLNISFLFSYIEQVLQQNQINRLGIRVRINSVFYQHFSSFTTLLQDYQPLKDIEIDISEVVNHEALVNSFDVPLFKNKKLIQEEQVDIPQLNNYNTNKNQLSAKKFSLSKLSRCTTQKNSLTANELYSNYDTDQKESPCKLQKYNSIQYEPIGQQSLSYQRQSSINCSSQPIFSDKQHSSETYKVEISNYNSSKKYDTQSFQSTFETDRDIKSSFNLIDVDEDEDEELGNQQKQQNVVKDYYLMNRLEEVNEKQKQQQINQSGSFQQLDIFKYKNNSSQKNQKSNERQNEIIIIDEEEEQTVKKPHSKSIYNLKKILAEKDQNAYQDPNKLRDSDEKDKIDLRPNVLRLGSFGKINSKIQYKDIFYNVQSLVLKDLEFDMVDLLTNLINIKNLKVKRSCSINISKGFQQQSIPQLQELEIYQENLMPKQSSKLCQVIAQMKHIKILKYHTINNCEDLIKITESLKQLESLSIKIEIKRGDNSHKFLKQSYWNLNRIGSLKEINFQVIDNNFDFSLLYGFIKQQKSLEVIKLDFFLNKQYIYSMKQLQQALCQNKLLTTLQLKLSAFSNQDQIIYQLQYNLNKYLQYLTQIDLAIEDAPFFKQNHLYSTIVNIKSYEKYILPKMLVNPTLILWDLFIQE